MSSKKAGASVPTPTELPIEVRVVWAEPIFTSPMKVENPAAYTDVAPIPPATSRVYPGTVVPIPTLSVAASAKIRLVLTSNPY